MVMVEKCTRALCVAVIVLAAVAQLVR